MACYRLYGLAIAISQPLTLLDPIELKYGDCDVFFEFTDNANSIVQPNTLWTESPQSEKGITVKHSDDWVYLAYSKSEFETIGFYINTNGTKVICHKPDSIPHSDAQSFIIGPVLGCVLRLRHQICLHASVMEYNGKAFAFVGNKGAGKSTTAAALLNAGARLISDDVAVMDGHNANSSVVQSGYPGVRLLPSTLSAFGLNEHDYERVVSGMNKRYVPLHDALALIKTPSKPCAHAKWRFQSQAHSLDIIYSLQTREPNTQQVTITNLDKRAALMAITPHGYGRRVLNTEQRADEFAYLAQLSQRLTIKSIACPNKLALLPEIANAILADVSAVT